MGKNFTSASRGPYNHNFGSNFPEDQEARLQNLVFKDDMEILDQY